MIQPNNQFLQGKAMPRGIYKRNCSKCDGEISYTYLKNFQKSKDFLCKKCFVYKRKLSYMVYLNTNNIPWSSAETKELTIEYTSYDGRKRTYRADFLVGQKLIEVKPEKLRNTPLVLLKAEAAKVFCSSRNLHYEIVSPIKLSSSEIKNLYDSGEIKFTPEYEAKCFAGEPR